MNLKEIREMIQLMNDNDLNEFELERDGLKIRLVRGQKAIVQDLQKVPLEVSTVAPEAAARLQGTQEQSDKYVQIKAPMVGTFYSAPSPEASAFVEVGSVINAGDVVCIIEAMKLMNEIKSEIKGKIKEVLVENGEPVEFGQPLFLVEPE